MRRRVLHLVHGSPALGDVGGTELYVAALARAQGATVLTRDRRIQARPGLRHVAADHDLWALGLPAARHPTFSDTWRVPQMAAATARMPSDVLHVHHLAHVGLELPSDRPVVVTLHDYHLGCVRGQLVDRDGALCPGPALERCGVCVREHLLATPGLQALAPLARGLGVHRLARSTVAQAAPSARGLKRLQDRMRAARGVLDRADRVLSPSADLARRVESWGWVERVHVQDLPLVAPLQVAPEPAPGPVRFVFVGALIPTKGPHVLLEAFAGVDAELTFWGPTPGFDGQPRFAPDLLHAIQATPNARYGGVFGPHQRADVLAQADVLVLPSLWPENSPLVVREAVARGLRVVVSDHGGASELDPDAQRVPPGDRGALRAALMQQVALGRGRRAPRSWPMDAHVDALDAHYDAAVAEFDSRTGAQ